MGEMNDEKEEGRRISVEEGREEAGCSWPSVFWPVSSSDDQGTLTNHT